MICGDVLLEGYLLTCIDCLGGAGCLEVLIVLGGLVVASSGIRSRAESRSQMRVRYAGRAAVRRVRNVYRR